MQTECSPTLFEFEPVERQNVVAGKSTLNRLEHTPRRDAGKCHKIDYDAPSLEALFVDTDSAARYFSPGAASNMGILLT
jgi:hypothetical protein